MFYVCTENNVLFQNNFNFMCVHDSIVRCSRIVQVFLRLLHNVILCFFCKCDRYWSCRLDTWPQYSQWIGGAFGARLQ